MRNILQHLTKYYKSMQHLRKRKQSNTKPYKTICENAMQIPHPRTPQTQRAR
jgi:hypothetical protein